MIETTEAAIELQQISAALHFFKRPMLTRWTENPAMSRGSALRLNSELQTKGSRFTEKRNYPNSASSAREATF